MSTASSHAAALDKNKVRNFTHILFDAKSTDMPALDFVTLMIELDPKCILIAISEQPRIDDVFGLLRAGARGFVVPPFTIEILEDVMEQATDGPALSEAVLSAPDRNAAFTAIVLNNLYRLSVAMRQAQEFTTAARDVNNYNYALKESMDLAQMFCEGNEDNLRDKIVEGCINRASDAATRLGRLRKKLKTKRVDDDEDEADPAHP